MKNPEGDSKEPRLGVFMTFTRDGTYISSEEKST